MITPIARFMSSMVIAMGIIIIVAARNIEPAAEMPPFIKLQKLAAFDQLADN